MDKKAPSSSPKPAKRASSTSSVDKWARKTRKRVDKAINNATKHSKRFIISRWDHIRMVRRDVIVWLSLILLLIVGSFIQTIWYDSQVTSLENTSGGTYAEGVVDKLTTISPLYANTDTEKAVSQLVYPGLLAYDSANKLHGQLATAWSVDDSGLIWTVKLRDNLKWADNQPLTADDVAFTVDLMKNENINSTLSSSWQTITVTVKDKQTIEFKLPNVLMSFDSALTFGVVPKHQLADKTPLEISNLFNQSANEVVGSGLYRINKVETRGDNSTWYLRPNGNYWGDRSQLAEFIIHTYSDHSSLANGLKRGEVNAISSIKISDINQFDSNRYRKLQIKTADGVYALFNNDGELTSNQTIRNALRLGLDRVAIRKQMAGSDAAISAPTNLEGPIATGVYSSVDQLKQPDYNLDDAQKLLEEAGWTAPNGSKYRYKDDTELAINIVTIAGTNYEPVANAIAGQWQKMGVNATVTAINPSLAQQNYLLPRNYDVLVYQMHLGADPDMFAYWSSTQTSSTGLNLANYNSRRAEISLSAGRTNTNPTTREARYVAFVNQWISDNPAIALYQPSMFYVAAKDIASYDKGSAIIDASNRFANTTNWTARTAPVMATP
ncbi:MAG: ABC transporter substrate-binding protein [Candidatus Saccharibacteria bacterium]|nr:ABC transporter substrate-binding protein [Candidatus Saccharibacteria bacterium]